MAVHRTEGEAVDDHAHRRGDPVIYRYAARLIARFGRRGVLLGLLGVLWLALGLGFVTGPAQHRFADPDDTGPLRMIDAWTPGLALVFVIGGVVAVLCAALRNRYPRDDYGFVALVLPAMVWGVFYAWSWLANVARFYPEQGRPNSWLAALVYWAVVLILLFVARWPDPDDPHLTRKGGRG